MSSGYKKWFHNIYTDVTSDRRHVQHLLEHRNYFQCTHTNNPDLGFEPRLPMLVSIQMQHAPWELPLSNQDWLKRMSQVTKIKFYTTDDMLNNTQFYGTYFYELSRLPSLCVCDHRDVTPHRRRPHWLDHLAHAQVRTSTCPPQTSLWRDVLHGWQHKQLTVKQPSTTVYPT